MKNCITHDCLLFFFVIKNRANGVSRSKENASEQWIIITQ